ncbi:MAG: autotransporter domain-containing protein [Planctomycetota bacterium]|jgi:uncharacterized protein with beta-barrel porin domain|nr:autotransporter domain-containing protein [Planctomycetota bacterium]
MKPYLLAPLFLAVMLSAFTVNAADLEQTLYGVGIPVGDDGKLWNPGGDGTPDNQQLDPTGYMNSAGAVGAEALWNVGITGKGVTAAVVDGGFYTDHEIFNGGKIVNNYSGGVERHGTHVAGTVLGMAPDAQLYLGLYNPTPATSFAGIAAAAEEFNIVAANNSWGPAAVTAPPFFATPEDLASAYEINEPGAYENLQKMLAAGVTVIGASGNSGFDGMMTYINGLPEVVAVGAFTQYGNIQVFSNQYDKGNLFLLAPGTGIYSASEVAGGGSYYQNMGGTSMASPHITGAVALLRSGVPTATTGEVVNALYDTGDVFTYDGSKEIFADQVPDDWGGLTNGVGTVTAWIKGLIDYDSSPYVTALDSIKTKLAGQGGTKSLTNDEWRFLTRIYTLREAALAGGRPANIRDFEALMATFGGLDEEGKIISLTPTEYRFLRVDKALPYLLGEHADRHAADADGSAGMAAGFADSLRAGGVTYFGHRIINRLDAANAGQRADAYRQMSPNFFNSALEYQQLAINTLATQITGRFENSRWNDIHRGARAARLADENREIARASLGGAVNQTADAATVHYAAPELYRSEIWVEGVGAYGDRSGTKNASAYTAKLGGVVFGFDRRADWWCYGVFGAWTHQSIDGGDGEVSANSISGGLHAGYNAEKFFANFVGSYSAGIADVRRKIEFPGIAPGTVNQYWLDANPEYLQSLGFRSSATGIAHNFGLRLAGGYDLLERRGWYFGPRLEGNAVFSHHQSFRENGADILSLAVDSFNSYYLEGGAGLELAKVFATSRAGGNVIASVKALGMYGAGFGDDLTGEFRQSGARFSVPAEHLKQMYVAPEASLRWQVNERLSLNATYRGRFGGEYLQHTGNTGVSLGF